MANEELSGKEKFHSCKYRSFEEVEVGEFSCCKDTLHMAYLCFYRNIEDLNEEHCEECPFYKIRKENL